MAFTPKRTRRKRPSLATHSARQAKLRKLDLIREEASAFDNSMLADMYVYACEQHILNDNPKFMEFMAELDQTPVSIEEFLDSEDFIGGTDLKLWPKVRESIIEVHRDWYKGAAGSANKEMILAGSTGNGKCLGRNTPVIMYDGSVKKVQTIVDGDLLAGVDSTPRVVSGVHKGFEGMYRITPIKGDPFECNESHILSLKKTGTDDITNISVKAYLTASRTFKHTHKLWKVGIELDQCVTPCDPYIIGAYLSDGNKSHSMIYCGDIKQPVLDYIESRMDIGTKDYENGAWYYSLLGFSDIRRSLLNESNERHIPSEYLLNSRHTRRHLLAGILDCDGELNSNGYILTCKDECYADQVQFLVRSLGLICKKTEFISRIKYSGFEGLYYRLAISGHTDMIPCKVPSKQAEPRRQKKNPMLTGFSVDDIGDGYYYGFTVDKDHLFLLGDFTVTHNTEQAKIAFLYFAHILGCLKNPQKVYGLSKSTGITLAIFAAKPAVMRKVVYMPLRGLLEQMLWFRKNMPWDETLKSEVWFFKQNMRITPVGLDADAVIGEAVIACIIDEANFFPVVKQSKKVLALENNSGGGRTSEYDQVQVLYDTVNRRRDSRFTFRGQQVGMIIVSSSKKYVGDFTDKRIEHTRNYERADVYIYNKPQAEVVPQDRFSGVKFKISVSSETNDGLIIHEDIDEAIPPTSREFILPIEYLDKFRSDPNGSLRDVLGIASTAISPFFTNRLKILQTAERAAEEGHESILRQDNVHLGTYGLPMVIADHICRNSHVPRVVHIDLALTGDRVGITMCHFNGMTVKERPGGIQEILPTVKIDMMCSIEPDHQNEIDIADIRAWVKTLRTQYRYPINTVTYDTFQSKESTQAWKKMGVKSGNVTVDRDTKAYKAFREMLYDGRVYMYDNTVAIEEMMTVEYDIVKDKVDHPYGGCFTGDTEVLTDRGIKTFTELVEDEAEGLVNSITTYDGTHFHSKEAVNPRLTKYTNKLVDIVMEDGSNIRCTPDHRILLESGLWVEAGALSEGDNIKSLF